MAFEQKNDAFDADRAALLEKATKTANAEGKKLIDAAHVAADVVAAKRRDGLKAEELELVASVRDRTSEGVFAVTRKVLADLADTRLEASIGKLFLRRLKTIDAAALTEMKTALTSTRPVKVVVRSAFDIPSRERATIGAAVGLALDSDVAINFETAPALLSGIELVVSGRKLSWSIDDYLQAMQASIDALVDPVATAKPA